MRWTLDGFLRLDKLADLDLAGAGISARLI